MQPTTKLRQRLRPNLNGRGRMFYVEHLQPRHPIALNPKPIHDPSFDGLPNKIPPPTGTHTGHLVL